jgi:colanic acid/amylovoran biosynthesis glycosyltransferase
VILYVLRYWPTLTETFVRDEVEGLRGLGLDVRVVALGARGDAPHATPSEVPVARLPSRAGWLGAVPGLVAHGAWPTRDARRVAWLRGQVRHARRVHVHFAGEAAALTREACAREGVPYSVTVHGSDLARPHPALASILRDALEVWTVTEGQRAQVLAGFGVRAHLVRSGVALPDDSGDALRLAPAPGMRRPAEGGPRADGAGASADARGRSSPEAPGSTPLVLTVARDVPKKGLDLLDAAVAALRGTMDVDARVVGPSGAPGAPGGALRVGPMPHPEAMALLARATVACLPCRVAPDGDVDGLPVFLLEALARGVPVVTTPVAGIPEVVDAEVGWLVPPDDADALARALREALADPEGARRRGARGPGRLHARGCTRAQHLALVRDRLAAGGGAG